MKAWKYLILVGGLAGLLGFFLPFAHGRDERTKFEAGVSAYELVKGINKKEVMEEAKKIGASTQEAEQAAQGFEDGLKDAAGFAVIAYSPAALLLLIGIFGVVLHRLGRLAGLFALIGGIASAGIWGLLEAAAGKAPPGAATVTLGIGTHLLLVAGLCGILAGFGALFAPDRG
jgi:hypothetical protein